jgi:hypothetical protein
MKSLEVLQAETLASFRVADEVFLIGSFERGLTVYSQQVRALNLVWALASRPNLGTIRRIGIVGGGIAGLTAAAAVLNSFPKETEVGLFEQQWDLCPLQQGADSRWLHPRIYDWPDSESLSPTARLPILDWQAGRASDVTHRILSRFGELADERLKVVLGARLVLSHQFRTVTWSGTETKRDGGFFWPTRRLGVADDPYDVVIVAAGFGIETQHPLYPVPSYWRSDSFAQPVISGSLARPYLISGHGDGALVDLCRLTIERFRQDNIVYEIFQGRPEAHEAAVRSWKSEAESTGDYAAVFKKNENSAAMSIARATIAPRIRKDTRVLLHLSDRSATPKTLQDALQFPRSSFLNKMLLFLLHQCGAVSPVVGNLDAIIAENGISRDHVICRFGANTRAHVENLFADAKPLLHRLDEMKMTPMQMPKALWGPGFFWKEKRP